MAITKTTEIGQIEIVSEFKHIQVRTDTVIKEDGTALSRKYHRHVLECGFLDGCDSFVNKNISGEDSEVQAICNAAWTQTVKDAWKAKMIADKG